MTSQATFLPSLECYTFLNIWYQLWMLISWPAALNGESPTICLKSPHWCFLFSFRQPINEHHFHKNLTLNEQLATWIHRCFNTRSEYIMFMLPSIRYTQLQRTKNNETYGIQTISLKQFTADVGVCFSVYCYLQKIYSCWQVLEEWVQIVTFQMPGLQGIVLLLKSASSHHDHHSQCTELEFSLKKES